MSKSMTGVVTSTKMQKTIVVRIEHKFRHPLYRKVVTRYKKFKAHYEGDKIKEGDVVTISETRPMAKDKHFIVLEKTEGTSKVKKTEQK